MADNRLMHVVVLIIMIMYVLVGAQEAHAEVWTASDTLDAIRVASMDTGVPEGELKAIIGCETGYTFSPYTEGDHGHSHGAVQINDFGNARSIFYAYYRSLGMDPDPYNPYQATYFLAETLAGAHRPLGRWTWSC